MHAPVCRGWVVDYKAGAECSGSQPGGAGKAPTAHPGREVEPKETGDGKKRGEVGNATLGLKPPSQAHRAPPTRANPSALRQLIQIMGSMGNVPSRRSDSPVTRQTIQRTCSTGRGLPTEKSQVLDFCKPPIS